MRTHLTAVLSHTLSASSPTWHQHSFSIYYYSVISIYLYSSFYWPAAQFCIFYDFFLGFFLFFPIFQSLAFPSHSSSVSGWFIILKSCSLMYHRVEFVDLSSSSRARWCIIESSLWIYHHPVVFVDVSSSRVCGFIIIQSCSLMYHRVEFVDLLSSSRVRWCIIESSL